MRMCRQGPHQGPSRDGGLEAKTTDVPPAQPPLPFPTPPHRRTPRQTLQSPTASPAGVCCLAPLQPPRRGQGGVSAVVAEAYAGGPARVTAHRVPCSDPAPRGAPIHRRRHRIYRHRRHRPAKGLSYRHETGSDVASQGRSCCHSGRCQRRRLRQRRSPSPPPRQCGSTPHRWRSRCRRRHLTVKTTDDRHLQLPPVDDAEAAGFIPAAADMAVTSPPPPQPHPPQLPLPPPPPSAAESERKIVLPLRNVCFQRRKPCIIPRKQCLTLKKPVLSPAETVVAQVEICTESTQSMFG